MQIFSPRRSGGGVIHGRSAVQSVVIAFIIWEIYVRLSGISPLVLPAPSCVLDQIVRNRTLLWDNTLPTVQATLVGFALSVTVAFAFSIVLDFMPRVRRALFPIFVISQTLPFVAIAPLVVLWFGFDLTPKVLLVALVTFFPMLVALVDGYRGTLVDFGGDDTRTDETRSRYQYARHSSLCQGGSPVVASPAN